MTIMDLISEVREKTHAADMEVLDLIRRAWPGTTQFTPTQCRLVVNHFAHTFEAKRERL